ncbi:MAG: delta(1)-pyrroline-2-carboxylate reductase family protein [Desulfovibrionaceae bacterium]
MRICDAAETARRLPYDRLVPAIADVLRKRRDGGVHASARAHLPLPGDGTFLSMPAADERIAMTKLVSVCPGNRERGLPTVTGVVAAMDAATGAVLGLLDGYTLTARRTAALSAVAARVLAVRPDGPLVVVGAGTQARGHVEAFREVLGVREVTVCGRSRERAEALADFATGLGMAARVGDDVSKAVRGAALVVTATTSATPVLPDSLDAGTFVAAVGAFRPHMAELPATLVNAPATRLYCDTLDGVRSEAGDYLLAGVDWSRVVELQAALDAPSDTAGAATGPTLFKGVGHAVFDLAATACALLA